MTRRSARVASRLALASALALAAQNVAAAPTCAITTIVPVAFGTYDRLSGTAKDTMGSITYDCSLVSILDVISMTLSTGSSGSYTTRRMVSGIRTLDYNLYTTAGRTTVFGNGTGGTGMFGPVILSTGTNTINVFGRMPPGQVAFVGSYSDTIVITLNF